MWLLSCYRLLDATQGEKSAAECADFQEECGIELDTPEMIDIEASDLCKPPAPKKIVLAGAGGKKPIVAAGNGQKRKRS
jgi:hypothetical protein